MKIKLCIAALLLCLTSAAQELFTFTEPASNMAAKSIGLRLNNYIVPERNSSATDYHAIPEMMVGVSKKIMVHGDVFSVTEAIILQPKAGAFMPNTGSSVTMMCSSIFGRQRLVDTVLITVSFPETKSTCMATTAALKVVWWLRNYCIKQPCRQPFRL